MPCPSLTVVPLERGEQATATNTHTDLTGGDDLAGGEGGEDGTTVDEDAEVATVQHLTLCNGYSPSTAVKVQSR